MHPYVITAKPGTGRRALRVACRRGLSLLKVVALLLVGVPVLLLRCTRAVINLLAYIAARAEYALAALVGLPPFGQSVGVGIADAFVAEFHRGWTEQPAT